MYAIVNAANFADFHIALLWLRSLEIIVGDVPLLTVAALRSDIDGDLFHRYRSPYKA